jgi:hypothetical protein
MMEAVRTSETSVENNFTRQYIPEDNSEHHTRRRENLKSQISYSFTGALWKLSTETPSTEAGETWRRNGL